MSWADSPEKPDVLTLPHERAILVSEHTSQFTAPFRSLVKQAKGLEGSYVDVVNKRTRLRYSFSTQRLRPIAKLEPSDFWKVLWDINRCSYLSWKLWIAHGDTSLNKMVYDKRDHQKFGILNDYDLAAITGPGDRRASQSCLERMGTIPFMTIDVLDNPNGELKRCDPPKRWLGHNFTTVSYAKAHFLVKAAGEVSKEEWQLYTGFLHSWMRKWADVQVTLPSSLAGMPEDVLSAVQQQDRDTGDDTYIQTAILEARNIEALKFIDALNDTSWINVQ